jgi:hypothetical protein
VEQARDPGGVVGDLGHNIARAFELAAVRKQGCAGALRSEGPSS